MRGKNILEMKKEKDIISINTLFGYAINYQVYDCYGDLQFERVIEILSVFFTEDKKGIKLNRKGYNALVGQHNFATEINTNIQFGGINKLDFQFNKQENKLVKTIPNVN